MVLLNNIVRNSIKNQGFKWAKNGKNPNEITQKDNCYTL